MSTATRTHQTWTIAPAPVGSADALALLRAYFVEVSDRYYRLHEGRDSTPAEIEDGLAAAPSDDLAAPTGAFLIGTYGGEPAACAGLRVLDARTAELCRVFVRPDLRGTGGGRQLMAAVDEAARALGAERIVLDTRLDLVEARALYTRNGYAEIPAYNTGAYAEIWYAKDLTAPAN
ncbi:GNAT family N-acetyltransferase [Embleya sp. NBC_00896]|uniref:GNAT family N-acetyltransferase n=1 Tax=Embleya sp. NBC_00896 TaxID=2975961 RepID=UPI002F90C888|nr:GNAT family N-acetyltransferase [Embleya sp. NBC_00896]